MKNPAAWELRGAANSKQVNRLLIAVALFAVAVGGSGCGIDEADRQMRREYDGTLSLERKAQILRDEQRLRKGLPLEP